MVLYVAVASKSSRYYSLRLVGNCMLRQTHNFIKQRRYKTGPRLFISVSVHPTVLFHHFVDILYDLPEHYPWNVSSKHIQVANTTASVFRIKPTCLYVSYYPIRGIGFHLRG
jgi:hypothetical protein